MTRTIAGQVVYLISLISQYIANQWIGLPLGWTICGYSYVIGIVNPWLSGIYRVIDQVNVERQHCYHSCLRSIDRVRA